MLEIPTSDTSIYFQKDFISSLCTQLKDGVEQIIYTDTNDNAHGVLEVLDDVYPEFSKTHKKQKHSLTMVLDSSQQYLMVLVDTIKSKSIHTFAVYYTWLYRSYKNRR